MGWKAIYWIHFGTGSTDDSMLPANEAVVLMAVSLDSSWKVPCSYFLTDGLKSKEKANLITTYLQTLYDSGVKAVSLTCDGPSVNLATLKLNVLFETKRRFLKEAEMLSDIQHENIPAFLGFSDNPYGLVMEYVSFVFNHLGSKKQ